MFYPAGVEMEAWNNSLLKFDLYLFMRFYMCLQAFMSLPLVFPCSHFRQMCSEVYQSQFCYMEFDLCFNSRTKSTIVILRSCNCILMTKYDRCVQNVAHRDGCKSVTDWVTGNDSEKRQGNSSTSRRTKVAITTGIKNGLLGHMHIRKR